MDGPTTGVPAVIRIETDVVAPKLEEGPSRPQPVRRTLSSPPTPNSPYHHSSPAESSSSSSEFSPTLGSVAAGAAAAGAYGGKWSTLKLHTNHIYSQSTQSLPASSSSPPDQLSSGVGMHSDTSLPHHYDANPDQYAYAYSYPMVKQLSPIAEQDYFSPDSLKRTRSLPPSGNTSRAGSDKDLRTSAVSGASLLTHSGSPIGSHTSEITRPSPIYASPFISRPLNRTASQTSSRTHVSGTSSAGPRQSLKLDAVNVPPVIPPLDLRPSFPGGPQTPNYSHPSPTGSHPRRPFTNPMPIILGSTEGDEMDEEYARHTDFTTESLHADSFVTASSEDRPKRGNFVKDQGGENIETVDTVEELSMRPNYRGLPAETGSVRSAGSKVIQPPSASESFITRRWDRDVALGPGVPTFRAKKQWIDVTPAFWAFWLGFLFPFLWLVGGWHFTHFGEQPPRLTFWEFYFNTGYWKEMCCGGRNKKREMDHMKREGKKVVPPPLPRWVSEKQSSELGRARLNDPKRSLRGISFGYPFIPRPVPMHRDESFFQGMVKRILHILGKPNRLFDHLYGIKLREVRGRPEGPRRMFDPWIQSLARDIFTPVVHNVGEEKHLESQKCTGGLGAITLANTIITSSLDHKSTAFTAEVTAHGTYTIPPFSPPRSGRRMLGGDRRSAQVLDTAQATTTTNERIPDAAQDLELLDIVLVATVDGKFHALKRTSGKTLWSMSSAYSSSGPSTSAAASTLAPLVRTRHLDYDPDEFDDTTPHETYIIEPQSGDIYVMTNPNSPLQRFPFSMAELVDMSPFTAPTERENRTFIGRKETSLILLELETGKIKSTLNSACPPYEDKAIDLDELEESDSRLAETTEVFIGRTDYYISIYGGARQPIQSLSFSVYGPNNKDNAIQTSYRKTKDDNYIQHVGNGNILSLKSRSVANEPRFSPNWVQRLDDSVVAVFDVLRGPTPMQSHPHAFVLLQPRLKLQDILKDSPDVGQRSAFIGMVEETGSLYALSPSHYPLIGYGDLRYSRKGRLIGGSRQQEETEAPQHCEENPGDRRCLLGMHPLDTTDGHESRMKRLLEGPKDVVQVKPNSQWVDSPNLAIGGNDVPANGSDSPEPISPPAVWFLFKRFRIKEGAKSSALGVAPIPPSVPTIPTPPQAVGEPIEEPAVSQELPSVATDAESPSEASDEWVKVPPTAAPPVDDGDETTPQPVTPQSSIILAAPPPLEPRPSLAVSEEILGFGSHGTVVFKGSLQGRAVAVKRLLKDFVTLASREVSILQDSDDHPNVIRYYYQEAHLNFLYIALELCPASLADIIECPDREQYHDIAISFDPKKALKQITSGLRHLHGLKLVHRDIKPQNILVSTTKSSSGGRPVYRMLISDFGLCKRLDVDQTSFLPSTGGGMAAGTVGWRAPEILRGEVKLDDMSDEHSMSSRGSVGTINGSSSGSTPSTSKATRLTKTVDIFALGCLYYYTLTNGGHPFGDRFEREVNILKNAKSLDLLDRFGEEGTEACDLIEQMLHPEAYERPDTSACLLHPFFWDPGRRLNFLQEASDRFEIMCREPKDFILLELEKQADAIIGNDWYGRLDKTFIENLGKFRKYNGNSVQDLLRALRNKKHHYQDLPDNVKRHLGPMPEGYLAYFTRRYPKLFLHVHGVIKETRLRTESMFRTYFELPES
ncbi:hypothetical protein H1R20_g14493, partial [Candolleomyces eurysporus]